MRNHRRVDDERVESLSEGSASGGTPEDSAPSRPAAFRSRMLRGGRDLAVREVAGIVLSLLAMIVVLRKVGPVGYGYVGVGIGISALATSLGALGLNVFLIRKPDLESDSAGQVLTLLVGSGLVFSTAVWFAAPWIQVWTGRPGLVAMIELVAVSVLFKIVGLVPIAMLERDLRFGLAAGVDFASLVVYYAVVIPAVLAGWGYMGVWAANTAQAVVATVAYFVFCPVLPRIALRAEFLREALGYGLRYQGSVWVYSLRDLAAPFLLPRLAGMEALGIVTAGVQMVQRLGFFRQVVWRLSISGLAKVQHDADSLRLSMTEGMNFQVVLLGASMALFSCVSSWLIPLAFSTSWSGVSRVFPFLATAALVNGIFTLHTSALFARGRIWAVTKYHVALVVLLWGASIALIPGFGMRGYLAAEMVALASYLYLGLLTAREIGSLDYSGVWMMLPMVLVPMFAGPWLPSVWALALWVVGMSAALALVPTARRTVLETVKVLRHA